MVNYYLVGDANYLAPNDHVVYVYLDPTGYDESEYTQRPIETYGALNDPFWSLGLDTESMASGQQQVELGLLESYRIKYTTSGIFGYHHGSGWWIDILQGVLGAGDDLGSHIAEKDLNMSNFEITAVKRLNIGASGNITQIEIYDRDGDADSYVACYYDKVDSDGLRLYARKDGSYVTKPLYLYDTSTYQPALYNNFPDAVTFGNDVTIQPHTNGLIIYENGATTDYLKLYHDGSNGYIETNAGNIIVNDKLQLTASGGALEHNQSSPSGTTVLGYNGYFYATRVYNAVYNDYADYIPLAKGEQKIPGMCYYETGEGLAICTKRSQLGAFGICSDTYGFATGKKEGAVPISIGGVVLAYVDKVYKVGTLLINNKRGILTKASKRERYNALAMYMREEKKTKTKGVYVKGRHWVKVK